MARRYRRSSRRSVPRSIVRARQQPVNMSYQFVIDQTQSDQGWLLVVPATFPGRHFITNFHLDFSLVPMDAQNPQFMDVSLSLQYSLQYVPEGAPIQPCNFNIADNTQNSAFSNDAWIISYGNFNSSNVVRLRPRISRHLDDGDSIALSLHSRLPNFTVLYNLLLVVSVRYSIAY
jgi:hypothetical protein